MFRKSPPATSLAPDCPAAAPPAATTSPGSIAAYLASQTPRIAIHDLDSRFGARRAYCGAGPERIAFLSDHVEGSDVGQKSSDEVRLALQTDLVNMLSSHGRDEPKLLSAHDLERTFTCQRNKEWVDEIMRHLDGKVHFIVVGAAHLFDIDRPDIQCAGLLSLLGSHGMAPQLVQ